MSYHRPLTLIDALQLLTADNAKLLAGGTDFYPALGNKCPRGDIVDITAIPALRGISEQADDIRFGAATTWTDIARATLPPFCNALQQAALEVGARQIQNAGTLGGNLCNASPAADSVPVLLALNARVELCSAQGVRQLPLSEFILGVRHTALANNELLSAIVIPKPDAETHSAFLKLGSRHSLVISIAMIAVVLQRKENRIKQAAICVGACSPVAQRLTTAEKQLQGLPWDAQSLNTLNAMHCEGLSPIDDVRASAEYRQDVVLELVIRAATQCINEESIV